MRLPAGNRASTEPLRMRATVGWQMTHAFRARMFAVQRSAPLERHSLRQNALWMFAGQGLTWVLTAVTLALLPRYLGPAEMGSLGIGVSFSLLAATVAGLGMATLITREVARDRAGARDLLATALWLHIIIGIAGAVGCVAIGNALDYSRATQVAVVVLAATVPFNLVSLLGFGALQGAEVMRHQAIWDALTKLLMLFALVLIVAFDLGFRSYLAVAFVTAIFAAAPGLLLMHRYLPFRILSFSFRRARWLVVQSLPFCTFGIVLAVYPAVDVFLLSLLSGERAVGIYSTPVRIFGTLLFGPTIIMTVVFPRLAASFVNSPAKMREVARKTLNVVIGVTAPVALLTAGAGQAFLPKLVGNEFADSGPVLMLLALVLVSTSINMVAHRVLVAADRQKRWTIVMCAGLVAKIVLDLALIPVFQAWLGNAALGAAVGFLLVETGMVVAAFAFLPPGIVDRGAARSYGRLALVALATAAAMLVARPGGFLAIGVAGGGVYAAGVLIARVYTPGQLVGGVNWMRGRKTVVEPTLEPPVSPLREVLIGAPERFKGVRAPIYQLNRRSGGERGTELGERLQRVGGRDDAQRFAHPSRIGDKAHDLRSTGGQKLDLRTP